MPPIAMIVASNSTTEIKAPTATPAAGNSDSFGQVLESAQDGASVAMPVQSPPAQQEPASEMSGLPVALSTSEAAAAPLPALPVQSPAVNSGATSERGGKAGRLRHAEPDTSVAPALSATDMGLPEVPPASILPVTPPEPEPLQKPVSAERALSDGKGGRASNLTPHHDQEARPGPVMPSSVSGSRGTPATDKPHHALKVSQDAASLIQPAQSERLDVWFPTAPAISGLQTLGVDSTETVSMPPPLMAPAGTDPTNTATPTAQLASNVILLANKPDGPQQLTIRLHPDELGMVQVRIDKSSAGSIRIEVTAEKSDTLKTLQRDQPQLHHLLDAAGFSTTDRVISFHIAHPPSATDSRSEPGAGSDASAGGSKAPAGNADANSNGGDGGGGPTGRQSNNRSHPDRQRFASVSVPSEMAVDANVRLYRIVLDITA